MSSARNHQRRSHRSEKAHFVCVHQMKQFAPVQGRYMAPLPMYLFRAAGKHRQGRIRRARKAAED